MLRRGTYEIGGSKITVMRDLVPGEVIMTHDFIIDGKVVTPLAPDETSRPFEPAMIEALNLWRITMPTYNDLIKRIAAYLVLHHGVATSLSDEAAARLVRECDLSTILVKGIASGTLGESPRQTFPAKGAKP